MAASSPINLALSPDTEPQRVERRRARKPEGPKSRNFVFTIFGGFNAAAKNAAGGWCVDNIKFAQWQVEACPETNRPHIQVTLC